jgi:hypothetical protein
VRRLVAVAAAIGLVAPGAAGAARVGWHETAKVAGARVMSYRVDSLSVRTNGWSARVSFKNLSKRTIRVGSQFGVAFYLDPKAEDLSLAVGFAAATKFSTPTPTALKPGESWTGVISGSGTLTMAGRVYARVVFGPFTGVPGESAAIMWITDHVTTVSGKATKMPPAVGPVI